MYVMHVKKLILTINEIETLGSYDVNFVPHSLGYGKRLCSLKLSDTFHTFFWPGLKIRSQLISWFFVLFIFKILYICVSQ
jgi:hypothetical protein